MQQDVLTRFFEDLEDDLSGVESFEDPNENRMKALLRDIGDELHMDTDYFYVRDEDEDQLTPQYQRYTSKFTDCFDLGHEVQLLPKTMVVIVDFDFKYQKATVSTVINGNHILNEIVYTILPDGTFDRQV